MEPKRSDIYENDTKAFLYFTAVNVHITTYIVGLLLCWTTPIISKLKSAKENPLDNPLTVDETSWLASMICLGAVIGPFTGSYFANLIGRKQTLMSANLLAMISFLQCGFSNNLYLLYMARFIGGISVGIFLTIVPMYIGEIAGSSHKILMACLSKLFTVFGELYCFAVGPYISFKWFSLSCAIFPAVLVIILIVFVPETPYFLLLKDKSEEANLSLQKFRNGNISCELSELKATIEASKMTGGIFVIFKTKFFLKALSLSTALMLIQQLTAFSAIIVYIHGIFEKGSSSLSKEVATILIGVVQIIATTTYFLIIDKIHRRVLMLISTVVTCLSLTTLTVYFYLLVTIDVTTVDWIPILALLIYIFFYNIGTGPLPQTILREIFPPHMRPAGTALTIVGCSAFSFVVTKIFPIFTNLVESWFAFLCFAVCNAISIVLLWKKMPETKEKTYEEIFGSFK